MKKLNLILIIAIVFSLALLGSQIYAQGGGGQQGGQQGGGQQFQQRQPPTPEQIAQMAARRTQMIKDRLKQSGVSEEESTVIMSQIEPLTKLRTDQGVVLGTLMTALQTAITAKDTKQIKSALKAYKDKRAEQKIAYEKAEAELLGILSTEAEATLTTMGMVNSDGGGMGFGGFRGGPGGPGQDQGGQQRQRNQQGQGNQQRQGNQPVQPN
jgi:hypothetical protein